jgi:hypothetical protein
MGPGRLREAELRSMTRVLGLACLLTRNIDGRNGKEYMPCNIPFLESASAASEATGQDTVKVGRARSLNINGTESLPPFPFDRLSQVANVIDVYAQPNPNPHTE